MRERRARALPESLLGRITDSMLVGYSDCHLIADGAELGIAARIGKPVSCHPLMSQIPLLILTLSGLCFGAQAADTNARDVIKPGDDLSLTVLNEPDLSFALQTVDQEGGVTIALLGRVQLAGKSVKAANAEITAAFANGYLINPGIALNIVSYGEYQTVSVQGKVRQPGAVSFRKGEWIDALRAIQRAGGLTDPKVRKVVLQRSGALESVGDIAMMLDGKQARMTLRDGDLLVVGE